MRRSPADPNGSPAGPAEAVPRLVHGRTRPRGPPATDGPVVGDDLHILGPGPEP